MQDGYSLFLHLLEERGDVLVHVRGPHGAVLRAVLGARRGGEAVQAELLHAHRLAVVQLREGDLVEPFSTDEIQLGHLHIKRTLRYRNYSYIII